MAQLERSFELVEEVQLERGCHARIGYVHRDALEDLGPAAAQPQRLAFHLYAVAGAAPLRLPQQHRL